MKVFLLGCFLLAGLWDGLTTVLGTAVILKAQDYLQFGFCFAAAVVVCGFTFGTRTFFSMVSPFSFFLKLGWGLALGYDCYTSFMGNARYVVLGQKINVITDEGLFDTISQMTLQQFLVVAVMTILISGAPIGYSFLLRAHIE